MIAYPGGFRHAPEYVRFMGFASVAFFGWTGFAGVRSMFKPIELVLSPEGFQVRGRRPRPVTPWREVERFFIVTIRGSKLVSYVLRPDAKAALRGRDALNASLSLTGADGQLPGYLDRTPDEVCDLLEVWRLRHAAPI